MKNTMRNWLVLLAVALVIVGGTGCSAKAKKAYHLSRANRYYNAGQFDRAEIEYLNVLHYDVANSTAFARLGEIYYDQGRLQRAMFFLSKGTQLSPDDTDLRLKLGFIYSSAGMSTQALAQANLILDKKPQDAEAPLLLAEASVQPKEVAAARQRLATLAKAGDRANIEVALGNLALRERDYATAKADFQKAQTLDPKSPAVSGALATLAWAENDLKQAETLFKAAADASPARSPRRMQYVRFKLQTGDVAAARAALADITKNAPDYVPALMILAQVSAGEKKYDEASALLEKMLVLDPDNFDALMFQGQLELAQGHADVAVTDMERMARLYPQVARVHYQLAVAAMGVNDNVKAANSLNRALDLDPNMVEATLLLSQIEIKNGNVGPAIIALERVRKQQPQLVQAQLLLADAYRLQNRVNEAIAIYRSLETAFPKNEQVSLLFGAALLQMDDKAGARKEFERVLEISPDHTTAIESLVDLDLSVTNFDGAMQLATREMQKFPKRPEFQILTAKVYLAEKNRAQAEATLLKAIENSPDSQGAYLLLAEMYSDVGENDKALAKVNAVMAKDPQNSTALMLAAKIYSAGKDYKDAANAYEKVLKLEPKFSPALNNLAYLYSEYLDNLDRAYEMAQRARELLPFDPATADTLGWVCFKKRSYDTALSLLQDSISKWKLLPDSPEKRAGEPEIQFHFGMANYMTGNETAARAALQTAWQSGANFPERDVCQRCLEILNINPDTADAAAQSTLEKRVQEKPDDAIAQFRLARIYQRAGNNSKAATAYEAVLQLLPKNLEAMVPLIKIYAGSDPKKAYDLAKSASKLAPYNPEVCHWLGRLAFQAGDFNLATSVLQQALQNQPDNATLLVDYAQAAYSIGKVSEAQSALQKALVGSLPSGVADEGRRMLDLIGWAANPSQAAAAEARIGEALKADPNNVPALMASAAASEFKGDRTGAAKTCEKILERNPDFTPAKKLLARVYAADTSKQDRAYSLAVNVHDTNPDDAEATKIMGVILVQRGDYSHAVALLKQSAARRSSDPEVFYYLGSAQIHLKNRIEGRANLQQALTLKLAGPLADSAKQMLNEQK